MRKIINKVFVYFLNGIVLLLPIAVTVTFVRFLVMSLNNLVLAPLQSLFAPLAGGLRVHTAKSIIFLAVILAVASIGWGARILFINRIFSLGESILLKVPIMGRIYNASKQIFSALFGHGKTIFKQVVLVEYPRKGIYSVGFTTGVAKGELHSIVPGGINVFIPTTPNPTSGMFIVVPKEEIYFLKMSVEDGMKMIISGGSVSPEYRLSKEEINGSA
jgi:uncharacterized membrane protein